MRPGDDDRALDKAREYGCDSRTDDAERGRAEMTADEGIVEHAVDDKRLDR